VHYGDSKLFCHCLYIDRGNNCWTSSKPCAICILLFCNIVYWTQTS